MAWWWPWGGEQAKAKAPPGLERKCRAARSALAGCRKANTGEAAGACKNLESNLVMCLAEGLCKEQADMHRRCYTSLYKIGTFKGLGHCQPYEKAMQDCLRKQRLYPV